jgi:integrase
MTLELFSQRPKKLSDESENILREELTQLWDSNLDYKEIAESLGFGKVGPYEKLSELDVFNYRYKFNLPPRIQRPQREHRYNIVPENIEMPIESEFIERLNEVFPLYLDRNQNVYFEMARDRAMLWCYFHSPLRNSEVRSATISDIKFNQKNNWYEINVIRLKKFKKERKPILIPAEFTGASEIGNYIELVKERYPNQPNYRLFPFSRQKALRKMKELNPDWYIHMHRFDHITQLVHDGATPDLIKASAQISYQVINSYLMAGKKQLEQEAELRRKTHNQNKEKS